MPDESGRPALRIVASEPVDDPAAPVFTIQDVADACGSPATGDRTTRAAHLDG
jgi:hypothetical protein